jgi:glycosyltransferase involved in cell wall biosynthesis
MLINFHKKNAKILSFQSNIFATIIAKILGFKIFIRSNTSPISFANSFIKKLIFKYFFNLSDKVIVNSNEFKIQFYKFFNRKPVLIYNPVFDLKKLNCSSKEKIKNSFFDKNKKYLKIINVARLTKQKDHLTLLKAIKLASEKIKLKLLIIGKGKEKNKIINYINNNKLNDTVKLLDYIKNPMPYIKHSDIFILSSIFEGLPNVLIEAQSQKKIIISSNCPTGPSEILLNGRLGFLYKTGDYYDLFKNIKYVSNNIKVGQTQQSLLTQQCLFGNYVPRPHYSYGSLIEGSNRGGGPGARRRRRRNRGRGSCPPARTYPPPPTHPPTHPRAAAAE